MKIRLAHADLLHAVQNAGRAVPTRTSLPALGGFLLEAGEGGARVAATDMEMGVEVTVPAAVEAAGALVVPARYLAEIARRLDEGEVELSLAEDGAHVLRVRSGSSEFSIQGQPPEHFPLLPEPEEAVQAAVALEALEGVLRTVSVAASRDEARPILTGVLLTLGEDVLEGLASDGYRIAHRRVRARVGGGPVSVILPARAVSEILKLRWNAEDVEVRAGNSQVSFSAPGLRMSSRVLEGSFPAVLSMLPREYPTRLFAAREPLLRALDRVSLIADPVSGAAAVTLRCAEEGVTLASSAAGVGSAREDVPCHCEGRSLEIIFNAAFLRDGLENAGGATVTVEFSGPLSAARITGEEEGYLYAVMPMRPQEGA